jgi:hypothetical protein
MSLIFDKIKIKGQNLKKNSLKEQKKGNPQQTSLRWVYFSN